MPLQYFEQQLDPKLDSLGRKLLARLSNMPGLGRLSRAPMARNQARCLALVTRVGQHLNSLENAPKHATRATIGLKMDGASSATDRSEFITITKIAERVRTGFFSTALQFINQLVYFFRCLILFHQGNTTSLPRSCKGAVHFLEEVKTLLDTAHLTGDGDLNCSICLQNTNVPSNRLLTCDYCIKRFHQACYYPADLLQTAPTSTRAWICEECFVRLTEVDYIMALPDSYPAATATPTPQTAANSSKAATGPQDDAFPSSQSFGGATNVSERWVRTFHAHAYIKDGRKRRSQELDQRAHKIFNERRKQLRAPPTSPTVKSAPTNTVAKRKLGPRNGPQPETNAVSPSTSPAPVPGPAAAKRARHRQSPNNEAPSAAQSLELPLVDADLFAQCQGIALAQMGGNGPNTLHSSCGEALIKFIKSSFEYAHQASVSGRWDCDDVASQNDRGRNGLSARFVFGRALRQWIFVSFNAVLGTAAGGEDQIALDTTAHLSSLLDTPANVTHVTKLAKMLAITTGTGPRSLPTPILVLSQRVAIEHTIAVLAGWCQRSAPPSPDGRDPESGSPPALASMIAIFNRKFFVGDLDDDGCWAWCLNVAATLVRDVPPPCLALQLERDTGLFGGAAHARALGIESTRSAWAGLCRDNGPRRDVCRGRTSDALCELFAKFHAKLHHARLADSGNTISAQRTDFLAYVEKVLTLVYLDARLGGKLSVFHCHTVFNPQTFRLLTGESQDYSSAISSKDVERIRRVIWPIK